MTDKQKNVLNRIISQMISITINYTKIAVENEVLLAIYNDYKKANVNIEKTNYSELNILIKRQLGQFLENKDQRQQIQEYFSIIVKQISNITNDNAFKELVNYIYSYTDVHLNTYGSILDSIRDTMFSQKEYKKQLSDVQDKIIESKEQLKNSKELLEDSQKQLVETKDTIDNLLPNLLTVLSILISIVIAVVIVYITVFLTPPNNANTIIEKFLQVRFAQYVLSINVVGDLFFLMMFMVARLTNRSILTTCNHFKWKPEIPKEHRDSYITEFHRFACADCTEDCSFAKKMRRKSAYMIWFNAIMVLLYFILYVWWLVEFYITNHNTFLFSGDFWFLVTAILLSIAISAIISIFFYFKKKRKSDSIEKEKNNVINTLKENHNNIQFRYYFDKPLPDSKKSVIFCNNFKSEYQTANFGLEQLNKAIRDHDKNNMYFEYKWGRGKIKGEYILYYAFIEE